MTNSSASMNSRMPQSPNTPWKLIVGLSPTAITAMNVVPMNEPMLTKEYWMEKAAFSSSGSEKSCPLIPERFPLNSPVPTDTRMIITQTIPSPEAFHATRYPIPMRIIPRATQSLGLTKWSAIYPPMIGGIYVHATNCADIVAPATLVEPRPPADTSVASQMASRYFTV